MINNYNDFITESLVFKLLLEGNMVYSDNFLNVLKSMSGDNKIQSMVKDIEQSFNVDVNIKPNFIDITDKSDTIKFIPDDKVNQEDILYKRDQHGYSLQNDHSIIDTMIGKGYITNKEGLLDSRTVNINDSYIFKLLKRIKLPNYLHLIFYYIETIDSDDKSNNGKYFILYSDISEGPAIKALVPKSNRTSELKIGRFVKRFFDAYQDKSRFYTDADIEKFVDEYTSTFLYLNNILDHFSIVEGEDIRDWYNLNNYEYTDDEEKGQLGQSCMRHSGCSRFFDIYVNNPEKCKLLIFKSKSDKLLGRSLLWILDDGTKYMDRAYTSQNSYNILFKDWGNKNGYTSQYPLKLDSEITVKNEFYTSYPYMDTFDRIKFETDPPSKSPIVLMNNTPYKVDNDAKIVNVVLYNYNPERPYYEMESTNGYLQSRL